MTGVYTVVYSEGHTPRGPIMSRKQSSPAPAILLFLAVGGLFLLGLAGFSLVIPTMESMTGPQLEAYRTGLVVPSEVRTGFVLMWVALGGEVLAGLLAVCLVALRPRSPGGYVGALSALVAGVMVIGGIVAIELETKDAIARYQASMR